MSEANFNIPFIPQEGISSQILQAMAAANQQTQQQTQDKINQQLANTRQQEADQQAALNAQNLPLTQAQTAEYQARAKAAAQALAIQQQILNGLDPNHASAQAPLSEPHIAGVVGSQAVANPTPTAPVPPVLPVATDINAAVPQAVADASIPQVLSQPVAPGDSATNPAVIGSLTGPASGEASAPASILAQTPIPTKSSFQQHEDEVGRRIGGFTQSEQNDVDLAREALGLNPTLQGLQEYQKTVAALVAKRGDPAYAMQVQFQKQGMSEPEAKLAVVRNQATDAALTKFETDPGELSGDKVAGSIAELTTLANRKDLTPLNQQRAQRALATAENARAIALQMDAAKKRTEQAIADGDPVAAGKLLAQGLVAPSQIISTRKPDFATKAFTAAQTFDPTFNPQRAEAQFKVAGSPSNLAFFGSAKSLTDKGGTLDQLAAAAKDIPGGQIPIFNTIADAQKAATGSGPIAKYASLAVGVADDYSKVMGGGVGSDSSREQALHLIPQNASPEARNAAIEGIRGSVGSQINSRIGSNKVMQSMYGEPATITVTDPQGGTHTFPDQKSADQFKKLAGIS